MWCFLFAVISERYIITWCKFRLFALLVEVMGQVRIALLNYFTNSIVLLDIFMFSFSSKFGATLQLVYIYETWVVI